MKRILCIMLIFSLVFSLAACGSGGGTVAEDMKTQYQYPEKYDIHGKYSIKNAVKDTNKLYDAICEAYPGRPVLAVIRQSYSGEIYPLELNDALNLWLEENGYGFSLMVYSFGNYGLNEGKTFEEQVKEYIEAGGRCDVIVTGANTVNLSGIPGDTVWDYVNDGLIVPLGSTATKEQLDAVSSLYGEAFLKINSDKGEIYGFSTSTLEVSNSAGYLVDYFGVGFPGDASESVRDVAFLNLFIPGTGWERVYKEPRMYFQRIVFEEVPYGITISETASVEGFINSVLIDESYTQVNMLPLYIHETETGTEVLAFWEIPLYNEIMEGYVEIVEEGILSLNASRFDGIYYYFESYEDPKLAQKQMEKDFDVMGSEQTRVVEKLDTKKSVTGPECSMFVANASENKALATEFVISALTDEALGRALCMGVEGVSYTVENGVRKDIMNNIDTIIYPNSMYKIPTEYELENSREIARELQVGAEFDLYENFNADLSDCREEAEALAS
ncbi:MAG: hypothetical protein II350_09840, partial [Clostridia bacterium]|nr:hypothetical protein [Clostridia bacterium]